MSRLIIRLDILKYHICHLKVGEKLNVGLYGEIFVTHVCKDRNEF